MKPIRRSLSAWSALAAIAAAQFTSAASAEPLTYFTWAGYDDPAFRKPFTDKHGADSVEFSFFSSPDEAFAKLKAGFKADVAHSCIHDIPKWKEAGLIKPIDTSKLDNWDDLIPALRDAPAVHIDGQQWMIPWEWGASSVIYRADKVNLPEESYEVLIDPAYQGRTALADAFDEAYQLSAILAGVKDPLNLEESEYAAVEEKMRQLRSNARFIWTEPSQLEQAMASGEIDAAWGWPNSFASLRKQNVDVKFMLQPKEGLVTWQCGFTIPATSDAPEEQVYDFIDALEDPSSGQALVNNFGYGHSNAKALEMVDKARLQELGLAGDANETIKSGNLMGPMPEKQRQRLVEMWTLIKAGG
ncbi:MAG TPA: extracellular solute-binding protein [Mesorhizobium sp.]|jgi:spermidine/putrescine-binding protein|nr:extracellular solute-binding protein [Mesorhizobium sp.]